MYTVTIDSINESEILCRCAMKDAATLYILTKEDITGIYRCTHRERVGVTIFAGDAVRSAMAVKEQLEKNGIRVSFKHKKYIY